MLQIGKTPLTSDNEDDDELRYVTVSWQLVLHDCALVP